MLNSAIVLVVALFFTISWCWLYRQNQRLFKMLQKDMDTIQSLYETMRLQDEAIQRLRQRPIILNSRLYHAYRIDPDTIHRN